MKNSNKKLMKIGTYSIVVSAIVLAVIILLNLFVSQLPTSFLRPDLTAEGFYTVGTESKEILENIDSNITIYYIVTPGNEDSTIQSLVEKYADSSDKITIKNVDPVSQPTFTSQYTSATLNDNSIIVVSDKRNTYVDGYDFYKVELNDNPGKYYSLDEFSSMYSYYTAYGYTLEYTQYFFGENEITGAIDFVSQHSIPVMYTLTGHGETAVDGTKFGSMIVDENVELQELSLVSGSISEVPDDAAAVLINAPTTDITEEEKTALIEYLDKGGKVILLTRYDYATKKVVPYLAEVCEYMGLEAVDGIIADKDTNNYYTYEYYTIPSITGNGFTSLLDSTNYYVFLPVSHAIQNSATTDDVETYSLLQTSSQGYIFDETSASTTDEVEVETSTYSLAYQSILIESEGTLIWFGSPNMIADDFSSYGNSNVFITALQSITEKTTSVSIIGKPIESEYLEITESSMNLWLAVFSVVAIVILATGIVVWAVRRRK